MKSHILFLIEKYHTPSDHKIGITNNYHNLLQSFENVGYGSFEVAYIDKDELWSSQAIDNILNTKNFDCCVLSISSPIMPSREVASKFGEKLNYLWWDSIISMDAIRSWANNCHQIIFDHGNEGEVEKNVFVLSVPQDEKIFNYLDIEKDLDLSFCGSVTDYWSDRGLIIKKIREKLPEIKFFVGGGRGAGLGNLSIEEYAMVHKRSKICLNLSQGHGRHQRKGRIFELASTGSFCMSNHPEVLSGWFEEGIHFASFDDVNLIEKIRFYLDNQDERNRIVKNFHEKFINNYSSVHFWQKLLKINHIYL